MAELITQRDILNACFRASEADAALNQWGVMSHATALLQAGRTQFGRSIYPRIVEIIQLLGTSSFMTLPSETDFDAPFAPQLN